MRSPPEHWRRGAGGTETRLRALRSIGVGGHICAEDITDTGDPYRTGLLRELAEEVDALSDQIERPRQWIIKKALVQYLAREAEKRRLIQEGLDDVTGGRLIPMEQARAWANSLGTDGELPVPKA